MRGRHPNPNLDLFRWKFVLADLRNIQIWIDNVTDGEIYMQIIKFC